MIQPTQFPLSDFKLPFVGRYEQIRYMIEYLKNDVPQVIVIGQESGTGKKSFVNNFRHLPVNIPINIQEMPLIDINGNKLLLYSRTLGHIEQAVFFCLYESITEHPVPKNYDNIYFEMVNHIRRLFKRKSKGRKLLVHLKDIEAIEELINDDKGRMNDASKDFPDLPEQQYNFMAVFKLYRTLFNFFSKYGLFHIVVTGNSHCLRYRDLSSIESPLWMATECNYHYRSLFLPPLSEYECLCAAEYIHFNGKSLPDLLLERAFVTDFRIFINDIYRLTLGFTGLVENVIKAILIRGYTWSGDKRHPLVTSGKN